MKINVGKERSNRLSPEQEKNKLLKQVKQDTDTIERLGRQIKGSMVDFLVRFSSIFYHFDIMKSPTSDSDAQGLKTLKIDHTTL